MKKKQQPIEIILEFTPGAGNKAVVEVINLLLDKRAERELEARASLDSVRE